MSDLPEPFEEAIFYEDEYLYACLANFPRTEGHSVVVWKDDVKDLHLLSREEYEHLMDTVDDVRDSLLEVLGLEKVYLVYMDEAEHVHWHLVPRYEEKGYNVLEHKPGELEEFKIAERLRKAL